MNQTDRLPPAVAHADVLDPLRVVVPGGAAVNHTRWKLSRERRAAEDCVVEPSEVLAGREQIRLALALGQLVYDRRVALGLTQSALGERLGMTADEVEAVELGGLLPITTDLRVRLAAALDVMVDLSP